MQLYYDYERLRNDMQKLQGWSTVDLCEYRRQLVCFAAADYPLSRGALLVIGPSNGASRYMETIGGAGTSFVAALTGPEVESKLTKRTHTQPVHPVRRFSSQYGLGVVFCSHFHVPPSLRTRGQHNDRDHSCLLYILQSCLQPLHGIELSSSRSGQHNKHSEVHIIPNSMPIIYHFHILGT